MVGSIGSSSSSFDLSALKKMQEEMFKAVDSNSDNTIDKAELTAFQQVQQSDSSQGGTSVDDLFATMDTDNDGAISRLESDAQIARLAQQMETRQRNGESDPAAALKDKVFTTADQNGDGAISQDELTTMLADSGQDGTDVAQMFAALDANQDGSISKSESDTAIDEAGRQRHAQGAPPPPPPSDTSSSSETTSSTTIFDAMDTNEDGTVSASELLAALASGKSSSSDSSSSDSSSSTSSASADSSAVTKIFDAMDTNEDGSVSKAELEAALTKAGKPTESHSKAVTDSSSATMTGSSKTTIDAAQVASAISSYLQAGMNSFAQESATSMLSSTLYG